MSQDLDSLKMTKGSAGFAAGLLLVFDPSDASPSVIGSSVGLRFFFLPRVSQDRILSSKSSLWGPKSTPETLKKAGVPDGVSCSHPHSRRNVFLVSTPTIHSMFLKVHERHLHSCPCIREHPCGKRST